MKTFFKKSHWALLFAILFCQPLMAQVFDGDIRLETQDEVDAFNYTSVTGNLIIFGGPDVTNLEGLSELISIGGKLHVTCGASNFNGLDNLVSIGGDLVIKFMLVTDMTGLGSLETIGGDFDFQYARFSSFKGLNNLREIGGRMYCCGEENIFTNFEGLESLTTLESLIIGDDCEYEPNNIERLNGLSGLTTITGSLRIRGCPELGTLDGLSNLTSAGSIDIIDNMNLWVIGLSGLEVVHNSLRIIGNNSLYDLDDLHNLNTVGGNLYITHNNFAQMDGWGGFQGFCGLYNLLVNNGLNA
jgi:hypothetical protein